MTTLMELADSFGVPTDELRNFADANVHLSSHLVEEIRYQWAHREMQAADETAEGLEAAREEQRAEDAAKVTTHTEEGEPVPDAVRPMYGQEGYDSTMHGTRI